MKVKVFTQILKAIGIDNIVGVPDSTLKSFCEYIDSHQGPKSFKHISAANEGGAIGIATGHFLVTGKPACVYMQNSGIGNAVNPLTSIVHKEIYGIPMLLVIGWRGDGGMNDEPQHRFMGRITEDILSLLEIDYAEISKNMQYSDIKALCTLIRDTLSENRQFALLLKRDCLDKESYATYQNSYSMLREDAIKEVLMHIEASDIVISTTGKISRETYEQSDHILGQHCQNFMVIGGMGHSSMIALAAAEGIKNNRVYCLDGDGSVLMHLGALPLIGDRQPENLVHICFNNESHESVGGMATSAPNARLYKIAQACGYRNTYEIKTLEELEKALDCCRLMKGPIFMEVKVNLESRKELGRPKESAVENKENFMRYHGVI